jgi:gamma-aminobutyric acid type B receptor
VVVISTNSEYKSDNVQLPDWQKGEEILPGARLAAKEVNDIPNLLSGHQLEVIPVRVHQCELGEGIVPFVEELTSNHNIIGIVGYFCPNLAQHLSPIAHYWTAPVVQISATSLEDSSNDNSAHYLQHSILPLREAIASATVQLIQSLGWNKIAIISNQYPNFVDSKSAFLKSAKEHGIQIESRLETFHSPKEYLLELQRLGIKIIVAFVPQSEAVDILRTAYQNGFHWPDYAWIFADINKPDKFNDCCQADAINNAIFLHLTHTQIYPKLLFPSGLSYSAYYEAYLEELEKSSVELNVSLQSNPYANVLYDSIWAVALTINRSLSVLNERNLSLTNIHQDTGSEVMDMLEEQLSQLSFQGATGWLNFSHSTAAAQTSVEIFQIQNGKVIQIGLYYYSLNLLSLNSSVLGVIPSDTPSRIYVVYPIALTVFLSLSTVFGFALTTVLMCLFIYYRNEPAIKATSNTLSLCMFIGCYFLLTSSLIQSITGGISIIESRVSIRTFICMFDLVIFNLGSDTILATVIIKTLRIYHIFKKFGTVSRICSDQSLFILISSIVSVKIVILIVWAASDAAYIVDVEQFISTTVPPFFRIIQECQSNNHSIWLLVVFGYSIILGLVMILLAVLTRKIERKDYKDSKKINILVVALIVNTCIGVPLWSIFRIIPFTILSRLAQTIAIIVAAVLCQIILILPKILPLVVHKCRRRS